MIKTLVQSADRIDDLVNEWLNKNSNIIISHTTISSEWISHTSNNGIGTIKTLMVCVIFDYIGCEENDCISRR